MANWVSTLVKVAGQFSPFTAALVQLQSEVDSAALAERLKRLEDPLRGLHPDLPEVAKLIYETVKMNNDSSFTISTEIYQKYRRCLALLEQKGLVTSSHRIGNPVPLNTRTSDPHFLLYLCAMFVSVRSTTTYAQN